MVESDVASERLEAIEDKAGNTFTLANTLALWNMHDMLGGESASCKQARQSSVDWLVVDSMALRHIYIAMYDIAASEKKI